MIVVGLDPSTTRFGVAFGGPGDAAPKSLTWKLPGASDDVFDRTLSSASQSVTELCRFAKATHIFIEAPIIIDERSAHTMVALMQLAGAVRAAGSRAGCIIRMVAVSTVRKHFCGNGRAKKPEVVARCALLGWRCDDDNAADACATWDYGMGVLRADRTARSTPLFGSAPA